MCPEDHKPAPWMTAKGLWIARVFALTWDAAARQSLIWRMMSPAERREYLSRPRAPRGEYKADGTRPFAGVRFWLRWGFTVIAAAVAVVGLVDAAGSWLTMPPSPLRRSNVLGSLVWAGVIGGFFVLLATPFWVHEYLRPSRRPDPWLCRRCLYDRRGLAANAPCPECGLVP